MHRLPTIHHKFLCCISPILPKPTWHNRLVLKPDYKTCTLVCLSCFFTVCKQSSNCNFSADALASVSCKIVNMLPENQIQYSINCRHYCCSLICHHYMWSQGIYSINTQLIENKFFDTSKLFFRSAFSVCWLVRLSVRKLTCL